ncbi:MAG: hypothetical protein ACE5F9_11160, partial [Phycisphaerae bacterium]
MMSRMLKEFVCVAIVVIGLGCCVPPAAAQDVLWKTYIDAGKAARKKGDYRRAERMFRAALNEAEDFGPDDPRL